jgi:hypothetical protein
MKESEEFLLHPELFCEQYNTLYDCNDYVKIVDDEIKGMMCEI